MLVTAASSNLDIRDFNRVAEEKGWYWEIDENICIIVTNDAGKTIKKRLEVLDAARDLYFFDLKNRVRYIVYWFM